MEKKKNKTKQSSQSIEITKRRNLTRQKRTFCSLRPPLTPPDLDNSEIEMNRGHEQNRVRSVPIRFEEHGIPDERGQEIAASRGMYEDQWGEEEGRSSSRVSGMAGLNFSKVLSMPIVITARVEIFLVRVNYMKPPK